MITTGTAISCLLFLTSSFYILLSRDDSSGSWWLWVYIPVAGVLMVGGVLVVMARATMVTLITVLVMLAFAGKRRRVLAVEGRKISSEVMVHLFKVVVREKSIVVVACGAFVTSMAMIWVL
ncbi:hypothetical protein QVD17_38821 [Tagetes erecta]|uniref:Uncharacterized protein n=1 Tax=Tagetes erecta TaxID=13708 RepID=A0AAD8NFP5_TARER|nr:hypothetical protein QVD17_38821 [Tagetes erecta]